MEKISVVIPCRNEEKYIEQCIQSFIEMDYPNEFIEILVVDGKSTDRTKEIIFNLKKDHPFIRYIENPDKVTPVALNLGIKNASNEFVMIASSHSTFSKNYISEVISELKRINCDGAGGVVITDVKNKSSKTLSICKVLSNKVGVGNSMFRIGTDNPMKVDIVPFGIYPKNLFYEVGFYNEKLIRNQDMEFSKRLLAEDKKIYLIPSAKSTYFARETFRELAMNNYGNGLWVLLTIYVTKKISSLSLRHFVPMIFVLSLLLPLILSVFIPELFFITIAALALYILTILFVTIKIKDGLTSYLYIFLSFITLHFSYGFGSIAGLFKIRKLFK